MKTDVDDFNEKQGAFTPKNSSHFKKLTKNEHENNPFNKRFLINDGKCYSLPEPQKMFNDPIWLVDQLQALKNKLNDVKSFLNIYNLTEWHSHTKLRNIAKDVMPRLKREIQPELLTQAWCKFYEIVSSFPLVPISHINNNNKHFKSIHLCEAPGAFITSLNHWLKINEPNIQWDWIATTLNPYYDGNPLSLMCTDDRFIRHTLSHWYFGADGTGNIMNLKNLDELIRFSEPHNDIFLVTADGSIDCTDVPGEQENVVAHLHFCETVAALHLLHTGGSFLLKVFTIFECHSVCLIYLLCCCFNEVSMVKPATSKEGNSETYIVCTHFKGPSFFLPYSEKLRQYYECSPEKAMFNKNDIPSAFIEKIIECSEFFKSRQITAIQNNIITFHSDNTKKLRDIKQIQHMVADKYITYYNLRVLTSGEIVGNVKLKGCRSVNTCQRPIQESYNDRCERKHLAPWDQLKAFFNDSTKIEIHTQSDKPIQFDSIELPEDLQITSGKLFRRIRSSGFCNDNVLKMQNSTDDILVNMGHNIQFPSTENINQLKEVLNQSGHKLLIFQYTDDHDSHKIINKIYDAVQNLDIGDTLVLTGYSLLSYLNVGLLYVMRCTFESLKLNLCNKTGAKIILEHYNYNMKVLKYLMDVKAVSSSIQETGNAVIQIISPPFLYECDLFNTIVDINHWVIKSYIHYVSNTVKGNI
ncbi:PREDICTED: cap-specific mRNA (nucleoside-2'-O-)-methyltransferase 2-like [Dufourea novaeangliae]|uniref:cap-specific mRNA (nucleoside-2'-O-)-methyltransferase 2-like n=1 Tax=Dufourea novaeangliae TaxID=178035 RepID=UPI000767ACBF|nr:PREDICTED: cap-specific mRNA (nucleoside-2'-O-)-methyltransferase 2-like [Dufourea novaeangliae]